MNVIREELREVLSVIAGIRIVDILDIVIVSFLFYGVFTLVRQTRVAQLAKGILLLVFASFLASELNMRVLSDILSAVLQFGVLALIIVFQPEIRRVLEQIGHTNIISLDMFRKRSNNEERRLQTTRAIAAVCDAAEQMSASRTGALMVFERKSNLAEIMGTGTIVNADPTIELLNTIFYEGTLLHDGATILRDGRVAAAGCVLPLSANLEISKEMGTRHRAALGMSENSDAVVVVVSEESGIVSLAKNGVLIRRLDRAALYKILSDDLLPMIEPTEKEKSRIARSVKNTANNKKEKLISRKKAKPSEEQLADAVQAAAVPAQNAKEEK